MRLPRVVGDEGDFPARQALDRERPVDDFVIVDGQSHMSWRIEKDLHRHLTTRSSALGQPGEVCSSKRAN
jgi:hypothetical protein